MGNEILPVSDSFHDHYLNWLQCAGNDVGIVDGGQAQRLASRTAELLT